MFSKDDSVEDSGSGESLLSDVEAISKALYLDKNPWFISDDRSKSIRNTHFHNVKWNPKLRFLKGNALIRNKKLSIFNWKPIKALTHIRNRRFNCCFFLHVHSIKGLPPSINNFNLCVHWKRKEELKTCPSRAYNGTAEFEETLLHTCSIYGSLAGPRQVVKYERKPFLIHVSIVEDPNHDLGKHLIDLTKLLPLRFEELEDDKSFGKWSTSFELSGQADGATLNVSFGFLVISDDSVQLNSNPNVSELLNSSLNKIGLSNPVGQFSTRGDGYRTHMQSMDLSYKVMPKMEQGLSCSINYLYDKLNEMKMNSSYKVDVLSESRNSDDDYEEDTEFSVIERGIEFVEDESPKSEGPSHSFDVIVLNDDSVEFCLKNEMHDNEPNVADSLFDKSGEIELKSDSEYGKMVKSCNMDDEIESVASDFLNMLEIENGLESPREQLLRQFEEDVVNSGSFLDMDLHENQSKFISEDFVFSIVKETKQKCKALKSKWNGKALEHLETKALMWDWGLNEGTFKTSPNNSSGGFGSPIYHLPERLPELHSLGEDLGPFIRIKSGGFLRSMCPSLFKNVGRLIIQASSPIVLPEETSDDITKILHNLVLFGIENLFMNFNKFMHLEVITGKDLRRLACEPDPEHELKDGKFEMNPNVSLEDLVPLAMDKIEILSIEGLKIQSGMSSDIAPSCITPESDINSLISNTDVLFSTSLKLDEWLMLDKGFIADEQRDSDRISKILEAHRAKSNDSISGNSGRLGNSLVLAFIVQLRDPFRNYEPIGGPMLALIRAERLFRKECEVEEPLKFELGEVNLVGLISKLGGIRIWGTEAQIRSGTRWLFNNEICGSRMTMKNPRPCDTLWNIAYSKASAYSLKSHVRNPDVEFPSQRVGLQ